MPPSDVPKLIYHDPLHAFPFDPAALSDEELSILMRNRRARRSIVWEPYMHNPKLTHQLYRVSSPTLFVRGASDGLVSADYVDGYAKLIKRAASSRPFPMPGMCRMWNSRRLSPKPFSHSCPNLRPASPAHRSRELIHAKPGISPKPLIPICRRPTAIRRSASPCPTSIYDPHKGAALYDRYPHGMADRRGGRSRTSCSTSIIKPPPASIRPRR